MDDEVLTYGEQGQILCRATFAGGVLHGLTQRYDEAQVLLQAVHFKHGLMDGKMTVYAEGVPVSEIDYRGGLVDGQMLTYGENGALAGKVAYVAGKPHGPALYYFPNGGLARSAQHAGGLLEGEARDYGLDGVLLSCGSWRRGKLHGVLTQYHPDGKIREVAHFIDGKVDGEVRKYDKDGVLEGAKAAAPKRDKPLAWLGKWIEG